MIPFFSKSRRKFVRAFSTLLAVGLFWPFLFLWARGVTTQISEYVHNSWRSEDGLPQNSVVAILQTRDGYLWLGTQEGLVRFNGLKFTVFNRENTKAFKLNDIRTLVQDRNGDLWIGSFGGGLIQYHNGVFRSYVRENGLSDNTIPALIEDKDGGLWIGTDNGLNRFKDGRFTRFGKEDGLSDVVINAIAQDRAGDLWVGTNEGVNRVFRFDFQHPRIQNLLAGKPIKSLYAGPDGDIWIGTQASGIYRISFSKTAQNTQAGPTLIHYGTGEGLPQATIRALLAEKDMVWAGTDGGGLCRLLLAPGNHKFECYNANSGLTVNSVFSIFRDREGSVWVGTATGGLNQFTTGALSIFAPGENPDDASRAIYEGRDGSLWIAMDSGLRRYKNGQIKIYRTDRGPANNDAWSVMEDHEGNIWVGTKGGGLNEFIGDQVKTYTTKDGLVDNQIYAVFQDHAGDIWVGTPSGLSRFHEGKFITYTKNNGLSGQYVWCIFEDHAGNIWIGTDAGMTLFKNEKFTNFDFEKDTGRWVGGVTYIYEDSDHVLWIGTDASGLKRFKDGKFVTYTTEDGMFDNTVWAVLEDDQGNFWMSSNRGIFRVRKNELTAFAEGSTTHITSISYGTSDGMPSTECNGDSQPPALKTRDGKLLFACVRGVVAVNPANLRRNPLQPPVVIESVLANKKPVETGARVDVGRGDLEFHFAALSYVSPDKVNFKYKLEGYSNEKDWVEAGTRHEAYYTNIPPGEYRFHVIASNNDGVWNETGATFQIYLLPRFYQTTWFYVICIASVMGAGAGAYLRRIRKIRKRQHELMMLVNERTRELQQEVIQRQRAEEALSRTAAIVEFSSDAIWSIDGDCRIVTWNSGAERLFGYTAAEAVGQSAHLIVPPERAWELDHHLALMLGGEPAANLETVRRRKDGSLVDVSLSRSPISKDGKLVAVAVIALDISARKRAAEALQHAKDTAEAATQAKSEFLANMSHEIRTPLNGVIGTLELAGHTKLTAEQSDLLAMAKDSANTLLVLINDILDFSKIEAGKLEFDFTEFDLHEMIRNTMQSMAFRVGEKQLALSYSIAPEVPPFIIGDPVRLKQVLMNLLGNAIKFTERGRVVLTVEMDGSNGDEASFKFSIADTGIGIAKEKQQVIFQAFSQADASTTRRFGGTGLGLAICSRIVALMGGRIWVESAPGKGSTFIFTAKLKIPAKRTEAVMADGDGHQHLEYSGHLRILVAEDNLVNQKVAARILEVAGHQVVVANSGKEALEKLREQPVDLVLMDLQMPEMDGFHATRIIREKEKITGLHLPIIAMTAHAMKGDREHCLQIGMDEYISKPVDSKSLLQTIALVMERAEVRSQESEVSPGSD